MSPKESITRSVIFSTVVKTLSRVVGMVRTVLVATYFGANVSTDGFQVASGIMFFFFLFLESAMELVTVPSLAKLGDNNARFKQVVWGFLVKLGLLCAGLTILLLCTKDSILLFLIPAENEALNTSTNSFLPLMILGSIAYIFYRFICLVERAQQRFSAEIISDLFLSFVLTIYIVFRHDDPIVLGESFLAANFAALAYIVWRSKVMTWDLIQFKKGSLETPGSFGLFVSTGVIYSVYLGLEKKLGASAPVGALTLYSYATVIFRFLVTYGVSVVQIYHPSFHENDGHKRFMQLMKLMWLYSVPIAFVMILGSDFVVSLLFSSKKMSADQLVQVSLSLKILAAYLFTELTGNSFVRYLISHGGVKIYNVLFSVGALISFFVAYTFHDTFGTQVLALYNLMSNTFLMIGVAVLLHGKFKLLVLKDYAFLLKLLLLCTLCYLVPVTLSQFIPVSSFWQTCLFGVVFVITYLKWVRDDVNTVLYEKFFKLTGNLKKRLLRQ